MNPVEMIKLDLGPTEWQRASKEWDANGVITLNKDLSILPHCKIYLVRGETYQFDFPMLPQSSYGFYAANGMQVIRLTRVGKEIENVLAIEWPHLPTLNPISLADLILPFYDGGIKESHHTLADADELRAFEKSGHHRLNESAFAQALPRIGQTSCELEDDAVVLRVITLCGWMHCKQNLGIENLKIARNGMVTLGPRQVLAEKIFDVLPDFTY